MLPAKFARAGLRATARQFSVPRTAALNGLRTYATAQEVKPPVALFGVSGTYATALVRILLFCPSVHLCSFCDWDVTMVVSVDPTTKK